MVLIWSYGRQAIRVSSVSLVACWIVVLGGVGLDGVD